MCSEFVLANWICSAESLKMVRKWPMADCYFKLCNYMTNFGTVALHMYRKCGKIRWAELLHFSQFSRVPRKFFCEYIQASYNGVV